MCMEVNSLQKATAILEQAYEQQRIYHNEYNSLSYFVRQIIETMHLRFSGHQLEDVRAFVERYRPYIIHHVQAELRNAQHNPFSQSLRCYGDVQCIKNEFLATYAVELLHAVNITPHHLPTVGIEVSAWRNGCFVVENEALPLPITNEEQLLFIVNTLHTYTHHFELLQGRDHSLFLYYRFETFDARMLYTFLTVLCDMLQRFFATSPVAGSVITAAQLEQWQHICAQTNKGEMLQ